MLLSTRKTDCRNYASYDPSYPQWKEEYDRALAGEAVPFTIYGTDGPVLEAAVSDPYILDGAWDEGAFSTGNYVIAIGPAAEEGTGQPTFSVGETVNIEGRDFTVMAVVISFFSPWWKAALRSLKYL